MRRALASIVLFVALFAFPSCSCNSHPTLSTDDAAKACVILEACFPKEWRGGFFGYSLATCATGSLLPPSPGALVGEQAATTGLEGPLADIYRCVLAAGADCAKASACWAPAGKAGSCSPSDSLQGGTCNGQLLSGCSADGYAFAVDCSRYGGTCHQDSIWFASVGLCDLGNCPTTTQCHGSKAETCEGQGLFQVDCAWAGLSCLVADGGATCDTPESCDGGEATCDGNVAVSCSSGKRLRQDCARAPTARRCEAGSCVDTGNECRVSGDTSTCDGTKVKFCQDGFYREVDCVALGFAACLGGACSACSDGNPAACGCTPTTCAAAGKNCGVVSDGCGATLSCGVCVSPQTCGGSGTPNVCGTSSCTPTTCQARGYNCGTASNGCGGTLSCGTCTSPSTCGGAGAANVCGCTPRTTCFAGQNCGTVSNGCGGTISCGSCTLPQTCGGGGTANVCGTSCTPTTCSAQGYNCGTAPDGCGGTIACGSCNPSRTCGAAGPNVCGQGSCAPTTCAAQGKNCGVISDRCGSTLDCGTCMAPQACVANVCQ